MLTPGQGELHCFASFCLRYSLVLQSAEMRAPHQQHFDLQEQVQFQNVIFPFPLKIVDNASCLVRET